MEIDIHKDLTFIITALDEIICVLSIGMVIVGRLGQLAEGIAKAQIHTPICPVYQNVTAQATTDPETIKANLLTQLTSPVRWTQSVVNMLADGASHFIELGPGKVLQGLVSKTAPADSIIEGMQ